MDRRHHRTWLLAVSAAWAVLFPSLVRPVDVGWISPRYIDVMILWAAACPMLMAIGETAWRSWGFVGGFLVLVAVLHPITGALPKWVGATMTATILISAAVALVVNRLRRKGGN